MADTAPTEQLAKVPPIPERTLQKIATDACDSALAPVTGYTHPETKDWNEKIINSILTGLIKEVNTEPGSQQYKFAVNSTIIQHPASTGRLPSPPPASSDAAPMAAGGGRRGMHSATGAYWNEEKDGMWTHKHEADKKGLDVILTILWVAI